MATRCVPTVLRQAQQLSMINSRRQFQSSALRLSANVSNVTSDVDFQKQVLDSKKAFVVDFHATWCGPCKVLAPRLEKVIANYNKKLQGTADDKQVKLIKVDIDDLGDLSSKYNVQAVPTVVAIRNGKEISRFTGAADESRIEKMIDQLGR